MCQVTQEEIDRKGVLTSICSYSLCEQCANNTSLAVIVICSYEMNSSYFICCCVVLNYYPISVVRWDHSACTFKISMSGPGPE